MREVLNHSVHVDSRQIRRLGRRSNTVDLLIAFGCRFFGGGSIFRREAEDNREPKVHVLSQKGMWCEQTSLANLNSSNDDDLAGQTLVSPCLKAFYYHGTARPGRLRLRCSEFNKIPFLPSL